MYKNKFTKFKFDSLLHAIKTKKKEQEVQQI